MSFLKQRNKKQIPKSKFASKVYNVLFEIYPHYTIDVELYFNYRGKRCYWDFFIRELKIAVECHGEQHYKFIRMYHGDREGFIRSKKRDNLKKEYADLNNITIVEVPYSEKISSAEIKEIIIGAINDG